MQTRHDQRRTDALTRDISDRDAPIFKPSELLRSPNLADMQEAYQIRAEVEEIAGRTAATVLKGYTAELRNQLAAMRAAVAEGDLDACAEHDVEFHRDIIKAAQNDVLLRTWDALAVDLRIRAAVGKISKDLHEIVESHEPIVNVIEKGHGNVAESRRDVSKASHSRRMGFRISQRT